MDHSSTAEELRSVPAHAEARPLGARPLLDEPIFRALVETFSGEGEGGVAEVFALFFAHMPQRLAALQQALGDGDAAGVRAVAHSIKGSCANFGALAIAHACERLEGLLAGDPPPFPAAAAAAAEIALLYAQTERQISELIK